ncbi:hypothetical protein ACEQPO_04735 [Bacillus sp. SL00103]
MGPSLAYELQRMKTRLNRELSMSFILGASTTYSRKESLSSTVRFQIKRGDHCDGWRS